MVDAVALDHPRLVPLHGMRWLLDGFFIKRVHSHQVLRFLLEIPTTIGMVRVRFPDIYEDDYQLNGRVILAESHVAVVELFHDSYSPGWLDVSTCNAEALAIHKQDGLKLIQSDLGFIILKEWEIPWHSDHPGDGL